MVESVLHQVTPQEAGRSVASLLRGVLGLSASQVRRAKFNAGLTLNGAPVRTDCRVCAGDTLVWRQEKTPVYLPAPYALPLTIPYEDEELLVVDKPAPLACQSSRQQPDNTLENALFAYFGCPPGYVYRPVNRLDKGTSGLMLVAKTARCQQLLQRQLHTPLLIRRYLAVTLGAPQPAQGVIDLPLAKIPGETVKRQVSPQGRPARTHYVTLAAGPRYALVRLTLDTGRTHQIRVHLAALGCPVAGDFLYGQPLPQLPGRFALHAWGLTLRHPLTGETLALESPLPPVLYALLR